MTMIEWAPVRGFDDYCATREGLIRGPSGKVLKPMAVQSGHLYILSAPSRRRGPQRKLFVHRAVLLAFIGYPPPGHETRHLDGDPVNNNLSNLAWGTRQENWEDRRRHGRMPIPHESPFTKLKPPDIPRIFQLHSDGLSSRAIGKAFSTSHTTILKILRGERWKGYAHG